MENTGEIFIYQAGDSKVEIEVRIEEDSVWLTQEQMSHLFDKDRTVITRHTNNIFNEGELDEKSNVQKMHFPNSDKPTKVYNLDVIISVGYRVKSKRGTQFRIWANRILKDYLLRGYALNENLLKEHQEKMRQLNDAIRLVSSISASGFLSSEGRHSFLHVLERYSTALNILDNYDYNRFQVIPPAESPVYIITYGEVRQLIEDMKSTVSESKYFGREKDNSLISSISAIYQTFAGAELYPSVVEKAANLLYFMVKNHSFVDGNKRIAAAVFIYFLDKNAMLEKTGLDNHLLVALTLMIANSKPNDKELLVNIVSVLLLG